MKKSTILKSYLVCERCNDYYKLRKDESPEDFRDVCKCGGSLKLIQELNNHIPDEPNVCPKCGKENVKTSRLCVFCGKTLKSDHTSNKGIKWVPICYGSLVSILITLPLSLYVHFTNMTDTNIPFFIIAFMSPFVGGLIAAHSSNAYKNGLLNGIFPISLLIILMLILGVIFPSKVGLDTYLRIFTPFILFGVIGSLIGVSLNKKVLNLKLNELRN